MLQAGGAACGRIHRVGALARDVPRERSMGSSRGRDFPFPTRRRREPLPWAMRVLILVTAFLLVWAWGWLRNADSRALASMNPDLRRELFDRSRAEAETLCSRRELAEECRSRVEFLARFPECDADCRSFVARNQPPASR